MVGIEYQGEQHYKPSAYFGGVESLEEYKKRDLRKEELCKQNEVKLLKWEYYEKIKVRGVVGFINEKIRGYQNRITDIEGYLKNTPYSVNRILLEIQKENKNEK